MYPQALCERCRSVGRDYAGGSGMGSEYHYQHKEANVMTSWSSPSPHDMRCFTPEMNNWTPSSSSCHPIVRNALMQWARSNCQGSPHVICWPLAHSLPISLCYQGTAHSSPVMATSACHHGFTELQTHREPACLSPLRMWQGPQRGNLGGGAWRERGTM